MIARELLSVPCETRPRCLYAVLDFCRRGVVEGDCLAEVRNFAGVGQCFDVQICHLDCTCPGADLIGRDIRLGWMDFETMGRC